MLFHSELEPGTGIYHDIFSFHLSAPYHPGAFEQAVRDVVDCHPILRATFHDGTGRRPLVVIRADAPLPLTIEDLRSTPSAEQDRAISHTLERERRRGFERARLPLVRFIVQLRSETHFQLTISFHHAVIDGWSDATLLTELFDHYLALVDGTPDVLPRPRCDYREFVTLEAQAIGSAESRAFWSEFLRDHTPLGLPSAQSCDAGRSDLRLLRRVRELPDPLCAALRALARRQAVPLKTVLLAAHMRALSVCSGETDILSCVVTSGRPELQDGERVLGLFINSTPFRLTVDDCSWETLIQRVYETERRVLPHRRMPLAEIRRIVGTTTLTDALFYFTDYYVYRSRQRLARVDVLDYIPHEVTSFPITVSFAVAPRGSNIQLELNADARRFDASALEVIEGVLCEVIDAMTSQPAESCFARPLVPRALDAETVPGEANNCDEETLAGRVLEQATRFAASPAVVFGPSTWTYSEFARRVEWIAARLRMAGAGPEGAVVVMLDRCLELPALVLGILRAGAAYVPVAPSTPAGRLARLAEQIRSAIVVTSGLPRSGLPERWRTVLEVQELVQPASLATDAQPILGDNLAYILHTSGSTGEPKGVETSHRALANRLRWMQKAYHLTPRDRVLQKTPIGFDVSVWELLWPLMHGACLVVAPPDVHGDPLALAALMTDQKVTVVHFVPTLLDHFLASTAGTELPSLRLIVCSGEELKGATASRVSRRLPHALLCNLYGPTEAAIDVCSHNCGPDEPASVPIGRPIDNVVLRVLGDDLMPVAPGVRGELYVGGVAVARGYRGSPDLTAVSFCPDPFGPPGSRLYRTGDLVRRLASGELVYCGRRDGQVKVRGVRIELGEIEHVAQSHPDVAVACAAVWGRAPTGKSSCMSSRSDTASRPTDCTTCFASSCRPA